MIINTQTRKQYEEKMRHGTPHVPVGLHKLFFPEGTDLIFALHWHEEFEFLIVTQGEVLFQIENREYRVCAGEGVFINSNLLHCANAVNGMECRFIAVVFSSVFLHENLQSRFSMRYILPILNGKAVFTEHLTTAEPWQAQAIQIIRDMDIYPEHELEYYELKLKGQILTIWNLFFEHRKRVAEKEDTKHAEQLQRLQPVLDRIEKEYMYEIRLADMAGMIPMSEGQFCRVFKKVMHVSPSQYLMQYRILQSCQMLMESNYKISDIANRSGFSNISYFNKTFLHIVGCTPREYREGKHNFNLL